jgi:hypothetical protein
MPAPAVKAGLLNRYDNVPAGACCTISTPLFRLLLSSEVKYFLVQVIKHNGYFYITTLEITMSFTSFYNANWTVKTEGRACYDVSGLGLRA